MTEAGYNRFPTIHRDTVVFVCEDDLWTVAASGGLARRLTSNPGHATAPALSPDGAWLAYTGREEGHSEVYLMPAAGGPARRLTYLGAIDRVAGWMPDGQSIIFASDAGQPFGAMTYLYQVSREGGEPQRLATGQAVSVSFSPDAGQVIGRYTTDLARWKRYRGGLTGDIWIDADGQGAWRRLIRLPGNVALPLWIGGRIYLVSDHEGIGNLYSCRPDGSDLRQHTHHDDYYVRHPATDGRRIVYHAGADLFLFDPASNHTQRIAVELRSSRTQRSRRFVEPARYLQSYDLHPSGHALAITTRGKPFLLANWEGAVIQLGAPHGVRYRLASWLHDGEHIVVVSDATGEERLEVHPTELGDEEPVLLNDLDIGSPIALAAAPQQNQVLLSNHRNELILVDLDTHSLRVLDRSVHNTMRGLAWSPDGCWVAYGFADTGQTSVIKLCRIETGETVVVTKPVLRDVAPAFDPDGKYLYFLSAREFDPVFDNLHFDLNFPWGMRPYLITLRADLPSPFVAMPRASGKKGMAHKTEEAETDETLRIDLEGISERIMAFPVAAGRYGQIRGIKDKALFSVFPVEGLLNQPWHPVVPPAKGRLEAYDFEDQKSDVLAENITNFDVSHDGQTLIYRAGNRLRVFKAGEKPDSNSGGPGRKNGWIDLSRIKLLVEPHQEWRQMYREAWRLQRDHFWTEDMSGVDWQHVYQRYLPLLERVATRAEFSDLMWEMQGELATSHAYEYGGDYPADPEYDQGFLAAEFRYDEARDGYVLERIGQGDVWDDTASSPLQRPGLNLRPGDVLVAINGRRLSRTLSWREMLVNQAGNDLFLTFRLAASGTLSTVLVKALRDPTPVYYREWVETNRARVHAATAGRVGYVHIPNMGPHGYAEFHRGFLAEVEREGLIVDVRYNGGGYVSQLILEKLARRRIGYDVSRWSQPSPYPLESVLGPMVALTNEQAGSDGDMFSHAFKLMKLGPLVGKRTWGGVIGINVRNSLVDGGFTTQPEYSSWFEDVGWGLENYGTDPDIEVDITPEDDVAGRDPQLERGITEILHRLAETPPKLPDFSQRPQRRLPRF